MTTTNPFDDLVDVRPILEACNTAASANDHTAAASNCKCTDPGHQYNQACVIGKGHDDHTRRSHCYYGGAQIGSEVWQRGEHKEGSSYYIGSDTKKRATFEPGDVSVPTYPPSLMFCADPEGDAGPTDTKSKVNVGDANSTWDTENPNSEGTANLGFE